MKVTSSNGNKRNGLRGQRVTFTARDGVVRRLMLPVGSALHRGSYAYLVFEIARAELRQEARRLHEPRVPRLSTDAREMLTLFTDCKARLIAYHGRRAFP